MFALSELCDEIFLYFPTTLFDRGSLHDVCPYRRHACAGACPCCTDHGTDYRGIPPRTCGHALSAGPSAADHCTSHCACGCAQTVLKLKLDVPKVVELKLNG